MSGKILKTAFWALASALIFYGVLVYQGRLNFQPLAPDLAVQSLRLGSLSLELPLDLSEGDFKITVFGPEGGCQLSESLRPRALAAYEADGAAASDYLVDISAYLGRPAILEVEINPAEAGQARSRAWLRAEIQYQGGYLNLERTVELAETDFESRRLAEAQSEFLGWLHRFLPSYRWLEAGAEAPAEGRWFFTRHGAIELKAGEPSPALTVVFSAQGACRELGLKTFSLELSPQAPLQIREPSWLERLGAGLAVFSSQVSKSLICFRQLAGRSGLESLVLTYDRRDWSRDSFVCRWLENPRAAGGDYLTLKLTADSFQRARAPYLLGLWRSILDSVR